MIPGRRAALLLQLGLWTGVLGCEVLSGAGQRPPGTRQVRVDLPAAFIDALGSQVTGLQLAAVVVPAEQFVFRTSQVVDPAVETTLSAYWPVDESPVLVVQTPGSGTTGPGRLLARLVFADGQGGLRSRLPSAADDLDLGLPSYLAAGIPERLQVEEAHNPLAAFDRDGDGSPDLIDTDDDDDGLPDRDDPDADGDDLADAEQSFEALADDDLDGIPDLFQ